MNIIEDINDMHRYVTELRREELTIGFVPTMGALHQGHLSLMEYAKRESDIVIASIFVNPTQFGPKEDYKEYPRDPEGDKEKLKSAGIDTLFIPSAAAMYPDGFRTFVEVEGFSNILCGRTRPGHFRGVTTVVSKLFNIVRPHKAFFGQKDFQQTVILRRMAEDMDAGVDIVVVPTVREKDGLSMSSRNKYLNQEERISATVLYRSLQMARDKFEMGERSSVRLRNEIITRFGDDPLAEPEYVAVVHPETLEELDEAVTGAVIVVAAKVGRTRLIDNIIL